VIIPLASNLLRAALSPLVFLRRRSAVPHNSWIELSLNGPITEIERPRPRFRSPREILLSGPNAPRHPTTVAVIRELVHAIAEDANIDGVLLHIGSIECGQAVATSLRETLATLRERNKKVIAWLPDGAATREYYLASVADAIYATPQSTLSPLGMAAGITFFKKLLARGGIEAEVFARREYKSAAESFSREGFSDANRAQTEALLECLFSEVISAIASGRKVDTQEARRWVNEGPWRAVEAAKQGMIDGICYDDELVTKLSSSTTTKRVPAGSYLRMVRASRFVSLSPSPRVGVVEIRGPIVSEARFAAGMVADARRIVGALRVARERTDLGAVVLHVDTRGGSALASDVIAREVERLKEKKPVVAYFSDVAASGGYYVSAPAQKIVAQPSTITGSFDASKALDKFDLTHEVIRRGDRSDLMSPYRSLDANDRSAFDREIDGMYNDFVGIVARGRGKSEEVIEPLARGRVYAGSAAKEVELVDSLGGLDVALMQAKTLAGGRFEDDPVVVTPPWHMPDAPAPPAAIKALLHAFGGGNRALDLLTLMLSSSREHLFAWDDLTEQI
jgi:protease IV